MGCNHDCGSCSSSCGEPQSLLKAPHALSNIKKVIGVVSGKGGVGKSLCTSMLAVSMQRRGAHCGILDADITGPSIPKAFGLTGTLAATEEGVFPMATHTGIDVCSINLLMENDTDPVIWRGPVIAGAVQQFWTDIIWKDIEYMFVDMPPGTGDVPLTVFQSLPIDGIIVMTSPQELVSQVVTKAVKMAEMMNIPILGIIENFSYIACPDCGKKITVFGESHVDDIAKAHKLDVLAKLPIDPALAAACDAGAIEDAQLPDLSAACDKIEKL
jgi:Mrp family chromosome partitioning ATPase